PRLGHLGTVDFETWHDHLLCIGAVRVVRRLPATLGVRPGTLPRKHPGLWTAGQQGRHRAALRLSVPSGASAEARRTSSGGGTAKRGQARYCESAPQAGHRTTLPARERTVDPASARCVCPAAALTPGRGDGA